jgi:3-oxoacyl-[acyl-carrier protein] reductase
MENSVAIVTGGTRGLGRCLTLEFGRGGSFVIALYHRDDAAASELERAFAQAGIEGVCIRQDVASAPRVSDGWASHPEVVKARHLTLVNNASAAFHPTPLHLIGYEEFERQWAVAVKGSALCASQLLPKMVRSGTGVVINVLSQAAWGEPPKGYSAYVAAKTALAGYTRSLAAEYSARGVRVFSVSPGFMETGLTADWNEGLKTAIRAKGTILRAEVVASRIVALALDPQLPGRGEDYRIE